MLVQVKARLLVIKLEKSNQNYVDAVDASTGCWARGGKQTKNQHNDE